MPCDTAMIDNLITAKPDQTVGDVLQVFEDQNIRSLAIIDDSGSLMGLITMQIIMKNLLPTAASMANGLENLDFITGSAPGAAKRLGKLMDKKVTELMDSKPRTVNPDTNSWEAVRLMVKHGSPIPVVEEGSGKFVGMISTNSLMRKMKTLLAEIKAGTITVDDTQQ